MLRNQSRLLLGVHQAIDLAVIAIAFYLAFYTKTHLPDQFGGLAADYNYNLFLLLALITCHFSLRFFGTYDPLRKMTFSQLVFRLLKASITGAAGIIFLQYLLHMEAVSRLLVVIFTLYFFLLLVLFKGALYYSLAYNRYRNYNIRHILVIGTRHRSIEFIKAVCRRPESGYRILGCIELPDQKELVGDRIYESVKVIGTVDDLKALLKKQTVDEVVFGIPLKKIENVHEYIYLAEEMGINIRILPDFQIHTIQYYPQTAKVYMENFMGVSTLSLFSTPVREGELLCKTFMDYAGALVGVIVLSPLFLILSFLIKCSSPGPVFFSQERCGLNGRRFMLHKFRTMVANAEELKEQLQDTNEMDGPVFKMKNDPRITRIGAFLRKTSLDELPQLFNVLKGEMSLVGPRPPIPSEVSQYRLWQRRRLSMKPGLTCIWQVSGRNDVSFEQWMNMDLEYIDNWSLSLDVKLLLKTVREVTIGGGH